MVEEKTPELKLNEDPYWKTVEKIMKENGYSPSILIETLHKVQSLYGFIDLLILQKIAESLTLPLSFVYGVVTFYHFFSLKRSEKHTCTLCRGTACYIRGHQQIRDHLENTFGFISKQTVPEKHISLTEARCLGICGLAPVGVFDGEIIGKLTKEQAEKYFREWE